MAPFALLADANLLQYVLVALGIVCLQIVEQATTLADQHEKATPRSVILFVRLEVLRQLANSLAKDGDLNLGTTGVRRMRAVLVDDGLFFFSC